MNNAKDETADALRVEQVDRDAAVAFCKAFGGLSADEEAEALAGGMDDHVLTKAFARYRIAALSDRAAEQYAGPLKDRLASARGHLQNVRAHGRAEDVACLVIGKVLDNAEAALIKAEGERDAAWEALRAVKADILNENGMNGGSIVCTVWHDIAGTTVDFIDEHLDHYQGKENEA